MSAIFNLILAVSLVYGLIDGVRTGFLTSVIILADWCVSIYIAGLFYKPLSDLLTSFLFKEWREFLNFMAFTIIFTIPFGVITQLTNVVGGPQGNLPYWQPHAPLSRLGGAFLGIISAAIGNGLTVMWLSVFHWDWLDELIKDAALVKPCMDLVQSLAFLLPTELRWWTQI
ncbi:MAG: CvpA family protein [Chloroflexota bacterium]|nr:CvpA family protein [Chloroflexota bacterium]